MARAVCAECGERRDTTTARRQVRGRFYTSAICHECIRALLYLRKPFAPFVKGWLYIPLRQARARIERALWAQYGDERERYLAQRDPFTIRHERGLMWTTGGIGMFGIIVLGIAIAIITTTPN